MKRLRVMQFLCCLSLMLCVTYSEVFSIKAFALTENNVDVYPVKWSSTPYFYSWDASGAYIQKDITTEYFSDRIYYKIGNANKSGVASFTLGGSGNFIVDINFAPNIYDYYFLCNVYCKNTYGCTFRPSEIEFHGVDSDDGEFHTSLDNLNVVDFVTEGRSGFSAWGKLNDNDFTNAALNYLNFWTDTPGTLPGNLLFEGVFIVLPKNQDDYTGVLTAIVSQLREANLKLEEISGIIQDTIVAIQDQTDEIIDKVDEVLTPEGEHNFDAAIDNVNDKINENMGALGFAHDTVAQFADLFTETPGAPVITVPPLKMSIKGQEYEFFHGYQYDFRSMETGALAVLVTAVRTTGTIVLWLAFLSYCSKEFNNFFRR